MTPKLNEFLTHMYWYGLSRKSKCCRLYNIHCL